MRRRSEYGRLKNILFIDKTSSSKNLSEVLKSDLMNVLSCYMDVIPQSFVVELDVDSYGYVINIKAGGTRLKTAISV